MNLFRTLQRSSSPLSMSDWVSFMTYQGLDYPILQWGGTGDVPQETIGETFAGYAEQAMKRNGPVFAVMLVRQLIFSEARFAFRRWEQGVPQELFTNKSLSLLERPEPGKRTDWLLSRMEQDATLAGNWFGWRNGRGVKQKITRLRPDWVEIILGSQIEDPELAVLDPAAEPIGYLYFHGGRGSGADPKVLLPEEVAHYAPIPDPTAHYKGMSWLQPIITDVLGDKAATSHKEQFFSGGGTPKFVVTLQQTDPKKFEQWVKTFREKQEGIENAYRTLFLGTGADIKTVGADLKQLDFKIVQGAGETRIAAAGGVPPVIVGLSEGLQAATYSNYGQARRRLSDGTMRPLWRMASSALERITDVPVNAELWFADKHIGFLQEDVLDDAEIMQFNAHSVRTLIDAGYDPNAVVDAVTSGDLKRLSGAHTGLFSVQLQPPGSGQDDPPAAGGPIPRRTPKTPPSSGGAARRPAEAT